MNGKNTYSNHSLPLDFLIKTVPFQGFTLEELDDAARFFNAKLKEYQSKEYIFHMGDIITVFAIVIEGRILIENTDFLGNQMILGENQSGDFFAETYANLQNIPLMVDVKAAINSKVIFFDIKALKLPEAEKKSWFNKFMMNMLKASSMKNIMLSNRSFHTRPKTARMRISSYLSSRQLLTGSDEFSIPFNRQEMADYLNLDRSALSKELSKMQRDGLLMYKKNRFKLNPVHFD